jgi:hypothetical protein
MASQQSLYGPVLFGTYEKTDVYQWTDPQTGTLKPIHSLKILMAHGDGTVTRESITLPPGYKTPNLAPGQAYGFPVTPRLNKKRQIINWDARQDLLPFSAPALG